uniref:YCII-related n=1 Tax=Nitratidesulfovibrio vulgaris (strain DSM 19637 / Miyazaki F) TaxID=883 RepID=B8DP39_NITV9
MFIVSLVYVKPLDQVDALLDAHVAWLREGYAAGVFLASGRKTPRTGGIILASGDRTSLDAWLERDPFRVAGVATCAVTEFTASMTAPALAALQGL